MPRRSLFDLHRKIRVHEIIDDQGSLRVAFRAPDHATTERLRAILLEGREEIEAETAADLREKVTRISQQLQREQILTLILRLEQPQAAEFTDLAPPVEGETEGQTEAEREAARLQAWEAQRRTDLEALGQPELVDRYVEQQLTLLARLRSMQSYLDEQLVEMVIDPESNEKLLSSDTKAPNWIGHLMPETRSKLNELREAFMKELTDKQIRKQSENASFLPPGESAVPSDGSLGVTMAISSISPPSPSSSSDDGSGSTP